MDKTEQLERHLGSLIDVYLEEQDLNKKRSELSKKRGALIDKTERIRRYAQGAMNSNDVLHVVVVHKGKVYAVEMLKETTMPYVKEVVGVLKDDGVMTVLDEVDEVEVHNNYDPEVTAKKLAERVAEILNASPMDDDGYACYYCNARPDYTDGVVDGGDGWGKHYPDCAWYQVQQYISSAVDESKEQTDCPNCGDSFSDVKPQKDSQQKQNDAKTEKCCDMLSHSNSCPNCDYEQFTVKEGVHSNSGLLVREEFTTCPNCYHEVSVVKVDVVSQQKENEVTEISAEDEVVLQKIKDLISGVNSRDGKKMTEEKKCCEMPAEISEEILTEIKLIRDTFKVMQKYNKRQKTYQETLATNFSNIDRVLREIENCCESSVVK